VQADNIGFWRRFARHYDGFMARFLPDYGDVVDRLIWDVPYAEHLLEVATGTGTIALALARKVQTVDAVDIAPEMIEIARRKAVQERITNVTFTVQNAYDLEFEGGRVDVVLCVNSLHVMKAPQRALEQIHRVLKPDGTLFALSYCHGENLRSRIASAVVSLAGFRAYQKFTVKSFTELIGHSGFVVVNEDVFRGTPPLAYVTAQRVS